MLYYRRSSYEVLLEIGALNKKSLLNDIGIVGIHYTISRGKVVCSDFLFLFAKLCDMAQYTYKIPGFRVAGYKIPVPPSPAPVATRTEVAAYIDSISNSAISLSVNGDIATFTFPAATPEVARAIANGLGDGNLVTIGAVRNTGHSDNVLLGYGPGVEQPAKNRKQDRG
jgi:hypothetical protein